MTDLRLKKNWYRLAVLTLLCVAAFVSPRLAAQTSALSSTLRTVSGVVTNGSGEPLKGAIVELENQDSHAVTSYLTDDAGHYAFRHLDSQTDFVVMVKYKGHHAKQKSVSKFNSHMQTVLDFKVKLY